MKTSVFALGFALAQVHANIPVKPHAMRCGDGVATCLSEAIPCDRNEYVDSHPMAVCPAASMSDFPGPSDVSWANDPSATSILNPSAEATSPSPRSFRPVHPIRPMVRVVNKLGALSVTPMPPATRAPAAPNTAIAEPPTCTAAPVASPAAPRLLLRPPILAPPPGPTVVAALPSSTEPLAIPTANSEAVALRMATAGRLTVIVVQAV